MDDIWFDDTATSAMGKAFDRACKSLKYFGTAPAIIANLIIQAAKNGERDPDRLYEHVLTTFGIEDSSMPVVSIGSKPPVRAYALGSCPRSDSKEPGRAEPGSPLCEFPSNSAERATTRLFGWSLGAVLTAVLTLNAVFY